MIKTAIQLKAKIRNISGSDSKVAMTMIRVFFMVFFMDIIPILARFLSTISLNLCFLHTISIDIN